MTTVTRSGADYYDVHIGFWTNWSHGKVQGSTLTVTRQDGNLLVAFVALFVAASGKSMWRLVCFLLHRYMSSPTPQDGLYHQRQAILRNSETPEDGAWRLLQLLWVWRKRSHRPFLRLLPPAFIAAILGFGLVVGGIFSAQLTSDKGSEVIISGRNCGPLDPLLDNSTANTIFYQPYLAQRATSYVNYALQCYTDASNSEDCNLYTKPRMPLKVQRNATCPFADKMCKSQTDNMLVDTGYLDSHSDLGINAPHSERFEMRYVYQCAPIVSEGFKKTYTGPESENIPEVVQYFYGNLTFGNHNDSQYTGFTHEVFRNFSHRALPGYERAVSTRPEFEIGSVVYFGGDSPRGVDVSEFQPIPELVRDDADVMLLFLSAQGFSYSEPVDDLWYSAHQEGPPLSVVGQASLTKPSYTADEPASALGCSQQFQMCNPHKPKPEGCEPLLGLSAMVLGEGRWSAEQDAAIRWFGRALMSGLQPISNIARLIGTSLLRARYNSMFGVVGPIPDDMWQLEVEHMISASLASLQASPVMIASGAPTENLKQFQSGPDTDMATKMCHNQKILSTRYSSFSALGLAFILFFGSAIIILDLTLEPMITSYHNRRARKDDLPTHHFTGSEHSRLEWRATSVLQLQRLAHAAVGSGTWSRTANETPVTKPFEKLAVLNISKRHCPVYQSQFAESSMEEMSPEFDSVEKCAQVAESLPATPPSPPQSIQAKFEMRRAETGMSGKTLAIKSSQHQEDMPDWRKLDTP